MKNNAAKFAHEFARMCRSHDGCSTDYCPLYRICGENTDCVEAFMKYPEKVVDIVEQWSEANPIRPSKTILSEFMQKFPNTPLGTDGTPHFCVKVLGYNYTDEDICEVNQCCCTACWKTALEDNRPSEPGIVQEYAEHKAAKQPMESMTATSRRNVKFTNMKKHRAIRLLSINS